MDANVGTAEASAGRSTPPETTDLPAGSAELQAAHDAGLARIFPGDSEMARRMRLLDWSKSAVGLPQRWPQNLRTALSICLTSKFPMHVWWGPDLTLFYNDGYISFLGPSKHPAALGRSGREAWAEIWDQIGPMIKRVLATGEASWSNDILMFFDRAIPQEEVYVTFSFSPVLGPDGRPEGLFCACSEATGKIVGARRLETLRRLGQAAEAHSVEEACRSAAEALATNPSDIPFARIYLLDEAHGQGVAVAGAGEFEPAWDFPERFALESDESNGIWPFRQVLETRQPAEVERSEGPVHPSTKSSGGTSKALVLPIRAAAHDVLAGVLVAAVSPRRPLDAEYRSFFDLVQGHIGRAIIDARAYEEERRRAEALAEIDRVKTDFFANVSHEFRTPITLMLGPLEDALAELDAASPVTERLAMARRNGLRLLKLVNNLLDFSRLQSGRVQAVYRPTDLAGVTAELASNFRSACDRAGIALVVDCPRLLEPVCVDPGMWEDVVLNLLSNALKFTLEGEIRVSLRLEGRNAHLLVSDTGVGIPPSEIDHIFERFQGASSGAGHTHEGSGIGLSLVQELVRLHGGGVTVDSTLGKSSTFHVRVPLGTGHLDPARLGEARADRNHAVAAEPYVQETYGWRPAGGHSDERDTAPGPAPVRTKFRVLVSDDNADMRAYIRGLLAPFAEVDAVADGRQALEVLGARRYDLVLADVMMPAMDGFELLRRIRASPALALMPVVLLSAQAGEEARAEGLAGGADDYLVKPFVARDLVARIVSCLALARARAEGVLEEVEQRVAERTAELARANAALRESAVESTTLRRQLRQAEEDERRRLARELHDQLGQHLAAFALGLAGAKALTGVGHPATARLTQLEALTHAMTRDARHLALELRPPELDDVGLGSAVETYVEQWSVRFGVATEVASRLDDAALPAEIGTALYRIVQEALTNVAKHAGADEVSVILEQNPAGVRLVVEDNGAGFDVDEAHSRARMEGRLGLAGMHERAALLGGALTVESSRGSGTTVYVQLPWTEEA